MSWSIYALGKPEAVAKKIRDDGDKITYLQGDEKVIKEKAIDLLETITKAYVGGAVTVAANGHAGVNGETKYQNLSISVAPLNGFIE